MMASTPFQIPLFHTDDSAIDPARLRTPGAYFSYFENRHGEQWVFQFDGGTQTGVLRGSDVDWQATKVVDGHAIDLMLNEEEELWLRACWTAAANRV